MMLVVVEVDMMVWQLVKVCLSSCHWFTLRLLPMATLRQRTVSANLCCSVL